MSSSENLCGFLDLVDVQSEHQHLLNQNLSKAFLALSREGYRDPASAIRLANMAPLKADTYLRRDGKLEFSAGLDHSPLAPLPSAELREAIISFRAALQAAVNVVRAREEVHKALDAADEEAKEENGQVQNTEDDAKETIVKHGKEPEKNKESDDSNEGEWQVVR